MKNVTCTQCGTLFGVKPYIAARGGNHFCTQQCYGLWQTANLRPVSTSRVPVACVTCRVVVSKQPNQVKANNFCGRSCYAAWRSSGRWCGANNPAWLGGHTEYRGPNWRKQSAAVRKRDGNTCQGCGVVSPSLPVHHKRPFRLFADYRDANRDDNLTTLCPPCHSRAEVKFWKDHPDVAAMYPLLAPAMKACAKCDADFIPNSWRAVLCVGCCSAKCGHCGNSFYSRRATSRVIKYCSKPCRNAAIATKAGLCIDCGGSCHKGAVRCKPCDTAWYRSGRAGKKRGRHQISPLATNS